MSGSINFIFDLGNVVFEWNVEKLVRSLALDHNKKELMHQQLFQSPLWKKLDSGHKTELEVIETIMTATGIARDDLIYSLAMAKKSLVEIDEMIVLLNELHSQGIRLFALSNMSVETYQTLKNKAVFDLFDKVVISGFIKMIKPDASIFLHALSVCGLAAEHTFFIDDMQDNVAAAEKLGIRSLLFKGTPACYQKIRNVARGANIEE